FGEDRSGRDPLASCIMKRVVQRRVRWFLLLNLGCVSVVAGAAVQTAQPAVTPPPPITAPFTIHTIATGIQGGYQTLAVDLNHDGKVDLIGLGSGADSLEWYENPSWTP